MVALPFLRTPLIPAAIAIGATAPDLPLFLRGAGLNYSFTHTFANVVWTVLVALMLFLVWRGVLRPAVPELVPLWLSRRLPREWFDTALVGASRAIGVGRRRSYPVMLAVSLVLGVLSHITWDLFTHEGRWGTQVVPALAERWGPMPGYRWLQHGSSVIGLVIIGAWALVWLLRRSPRSQVVQRVPAVVRVAWWLSLPALLIAAWVWGMAFHGPLTEAFTAQHLAYRMLPPACAVWGAITTALCVVISLRGGAQPPADPGAR